jgi:hypothetical protein
MLPTMEGREFMGLDRGAALAECRCRAAAFWHYVQGRWPELRDYRRCWIAPSPGVRESSRVLGEYVLTEYDLLAGLSGRRQQVQLEFPLPADLLRHVTES